MKGHVKIPVAAATVALFATVIFLFQNCTQAVGKANPATAKGKYTSIQDNGTGYGGKTFIHRLVSGVCNDSSDIQAQIVTISPTTAILKRENCENIEQRQVQVDRVFRGGDEVLTYDVAIVNNMIFDSTETPPTERFCYRDTIEGTQTRSTEIIFQNGAGSTINGFIRSLLNNTTVSDSGNYSVGFPAMSTQNVSNETYETTNPIGADGVRVTLTAVDGNSTETNGALAVTTLNNNDRLDVSMLNCFAHSTAATIVDPIPGTTPDSPPPAINPEPLTCTNLTINSKPSSADLIALTGTDINTANAILSGVIGSNIDKRNWSLIMSDESPLSAARSATGAMYNSPYCRDPGAMKAPYTSNGFQVSVIAEAGNFQFQKQTSAAGTQYWIRLVDFEGYELTTATSCAKVPGLALNYGFDYSVIITTIEPMVLARGEASARTWIQQCPAH